MLLSSFNLKTAASLRISNSFAFCKHSEVRQGFAYCTIDLACMILNATRSFLVRSQSR